MKSIFLFSFFLFLALDSSAQSCLMNADIYFMYRNEVSDRIILNKIQSSDCCFSVSPADIVDLTREGISEAIINKMIYVMERRNAQQKYYNRAVVRPRVLMRYRTPRIHIRGNF